MLWLHQVHLLGYHFFPCLLGKTRVSVCSWSGSAYIHSFLYSIFISLNNHTFFPLPVFSFPHLSFLSFPVVLFLLSPSFLLSLSLFFLFQLAFLVFPGHASFWLLVFPFLWLPLPPVFLSVSLLLIFAFPVFLFPTLKSEKYLLQFNLHPRDNYGDINSFIKSLWIQRSFSISY